jgi:hypothetical protein
VCIYPPTNKKEPQRLLLSASEELEGKATRYRWERNEMSQLKDLRK